MLMKIKLKPFFSYFSKSSKIIILGFFFLIAALIFIGARLPSSYFTTSLESRTLQVHGFAQKSVPTDYACWNLILEVTHQDYPTALLQAENESDIILGFLEKNGFENDKEIEKQLPSVLKQKPPSVFFFKKPFVEALEISASNFKKFSLIVTFLPPEIVDSKFLIPVLILESLYLLISARFSFCKILFFADLIFAIVKFLYCSKHGGSRLI